jgi:hypothetical protein
MNIGARRGIAAEQAAAAEAKRTEAALADAPSRRRKLENVARSCAWRAKAYARKWKWKGYGFVLLRGAPSFRQLLRQAVMNDTGRDPVREWEAWDGKPDPKQAHISTGERLASVGQFLIGGGFDHAYPDAVEALREWKIQK